ncbi:vesicle-associated protein 4-1-like isoform X2 [Daucus carota subsp. sativus]|uniref:vesicle-associated protein 4-1-like isoform X2 n=1 Tax=Daucus carota subsp. sativus TaxID=79200 RepID=UPI0007EFFB40|nr:PREDICTED: vesicle-associated protein 4-1-like isoform X2 [Daucus carota subsp. sativus]
MAGGFGNVKLETEDEKVWSICRMPFWNSTTISSDVDNNSNMHHQTQLGFDTASTHHHHSSTSLSSLAMSLLPTRRRLSLDPTNKLFFPYEPGKQARSAVRIKNISKTHVAFKTTAPKSCYMRPPGGILTPGESSLATVFKFVEPPVKGEKFLGQKSRVKFKIMSLKVEPGTDYIPELFDEQKDQVLVEQILQVVFLDKEGPSRELEKLNSQLVEAEAELETHKNRQEDSGPRIVGEGLIIDEWKERRERYLARQQVEGLELV